MLALITLAVASEQDLFGAECAEPAGPREARAWVEGERGSPAEFVFLDFHEQFNKFDDPDCHVPCDPTWLVERQGWTSDELKASECWSASCEVFDGSHFEGTSIFAASQDDSYAWVAELSLTSSESEGGSDAYLDVALDSRNMGMGVARQDRWHFGWSGGFVSGFPDSGWVVSSRESNGDDSILRPNAESWQDSVGCEWSLTQTVDPDEDRVAVGQYDIVVFPSETDAVRLCARQDGVELGEVDSDTWARVESDGVCPAGPEPEGCAQVAAPWVAFGLLHHRRARRRAAPR